ncbi:MAG: carbohydrate-binding protein [Armatimonadia bacterium]|nr:carbohydrate-binding protein [Armatimonadia bacterium]
MRPELMVLVALVSLPSGHAVARTLHVNPDCGMYGSIQAAVDEAQPGDVVSIHTGVYRETVTFERSGSARAPIVVRAHGDGPVVVTGCEPLSGWRLEDRVAGIWSAPMPWTLGLGRDQVFDQRGPLLEARHPNTPMPGLEMYVGGLSPLWPTFAGCHIPKETSEEQPGRITSDLLAGDPPDHWKGALYYGVHYEGWSAQTGVVAESSPGVIHVEDRTRGWWFTGMYTEDEGRGMLVGHRNALDAPGEWLWEDGRLYLIPREGEPVGIEAKRRQLAFDLSGQSHIALEGIQVHGASMRLVGSSHCTVRRCSLSYISHFTKFDGMGDLEDGVDNIRSGETGIFVGGHDNAFTDCAIRVSAGAGFHLRGYHHTIHNCLIDQANYTSHYLNAITDAVTDYHQYEGRLVGGHVITYNTMRNAGRHFFNFYGNGTSLHSRDRGPMDYMATLFAHNHLYNGMLQTRDAGLITGYYSSGGTLCDLSSQVAHNVIHDSFDIFAMRIGALGLVYLDAGTCDVDLHHNLLWAAPGTLQRGVWFNTACVDVDEWGNRFHPDFTRTVGQLTPEDFPGGEPFRFGHDFQHSPPVPDWPPVTKRVWRIGGRPLRDGSIVRIPAVDFGDGQTAAVLDVRCDREDVNVDRSTRVAPRHQHATDPLVMEATENDGTSDDVREQWTFLYDLTDGAWVRFSDVPLGEGYERVRVIYGRDQPEPGRLELRLGSSNGPIVARIDLRTTDEPRAGHVQRYEEATAELSETAVGTHDLFLVARSEDDESVASVEYLRLERYRGELPRRSDEGIIEIRLDSPEGRKIGTIWPRKADEDGETWRMVCPLEPAQGTHDVYLVTRTNVPGTLAAVDGFELWRAGAGIDWPSISAPPRRTSSGDLVLPEPTNPPRSRPGDQY